MRAAQNGKQVAVVLELKARFDEEANIKWASRMERAGIHVTYGVVGLKTHTKITLVVRHDYDGLRRYAHVATGNYHAGTARLYTDLGLFTCDDGDRPRSHRAVQLPDDRLQAAPQVPEAARRAQAAQAGAAREDRARDRARQGSGERGHIQWKLNALEDVDIVRALYRASQRGVTIDLIVRDTCRLRPGLDGVSSTIKVVSVIGRFLEHARIYYFHNGGTRRVLHRLGGRDAAQPREARRGARARSKIRACRPSCASSSTPSSPISAARGTCSESRLLAEARKVSRFTLEQNEAGVRLPEPDREDMEVFLSRVRQLLPVLGSDILIPIAQPVPTKTRVECFFAE